MITHKLWIKVSVLLAVLLIVTACAPQAVSETKAPDTIEQVFTVAVARDPGPLNPHDTVSIFPALSMIFESLVAYKDD